MADANRIVGRVRAVARGGEAIVETHEGVVFVAGGLPNERVEVARTGARRGAARGRIVDIIERSPARRRAECPRVDACGGCPLMIAEPELQREVKRQFLREACRGLPGSERVRVGWVPSSRQIAYRRRARLAWKKERFGYRARRSNHVLDVEGCAILDTRLARAWAATREHLGGTLVGEGEIDLAGYGDVAVVGLRAVQPQSAAAFGACNRLSKVPGIEGVQLSVGGGAPARWGSVALQLESEDGHLTACGPESFIQANAAVNDRLVREVVRLAEAHGRRVLELHAGIGNFTLPLARTAERVVAVERDASAARTCRENLAAHGLEARVVEGDADAPPHGQYDVLVLDPPRKGAKTLFEGSGSWQRVRRIVYVSCDTATLRRDLRRACAVGFALDYAVAFDMFPQTAHVESVVRLVR